MQGESRERLRGERMTRNHAFDVTTHATWVTHAPLVRACMPCVFTDAAGIYAFTLSVSRVRAKLHGTFTDPQDFKKLKMWHGVKVLRTCGCTGGGPAEG